MGQCCCAGSRVFVQEGIYDEFVKRSVAAAKASKVGDPLMAGVTHGPQISEIQRTKILGYVDSGKKEGANLLTGGSKWGNKGYFVEPTIFADVQDHMTIAKEEIFGPVMSIFKFKTVEEVIRRANESNYGLGGGVVTSSIDNAIALSNGLRTGAVWINCYDVLHANLPFGGFKDSGIGRELGFDGIKNYIESKTVVYKRPDNAFP